MGLILQRANEALDINPTPGIEEQLSVNGSNWLWTCVAIYSVFFVRTPCRTSPLSSSF